MTEAFDPNKIAAEFIQANLDKAFAIGAGPLKGVRNFVRSKFERTYKAYVNRLLDRHSKAKSFFVRSEPIPLYDFFVPLDLRTQQRVLKSPGATDIAAVSRFAILTGSGGSGKSMVMRHVLISALSSRAKTPVFLELRQLDLADGTLEDALLKSLQVNGLEIDESYFTLALTAGHFLFLFDGFDELEQRVRVKLTKAVQALAEKYPKNWIVLSSRPDPELEGWTAFTLFRVEPLDISKAVELVQRLNFDVEIKGRFLQDLKADLFLRHKSFLSNPLLLSIMLLTYQDTAHIPSKLSIFYNQAYESLFQKHDALKGGYQRQRRTALDIQDFSRVFAAFCVRTYDRRQFAFSVSNALDVLERCKALTRLDYDSQAFLDDASQAVCLLVEEGVDLTFAHRSFQEYFTARFIATSPPQVKAQLIGRFGRSMGADAVIPLLHEIEPYAVEQHLLLPALQRVKKQLSVKRSVGVTHLLSFIRTMYSSFENSSDEKRGVTAVIADPRTFHVVRFARLHYCQAPETLDPSTRDRNRTQLKAAFDAEFQGKSSVLASRISRNGPFLRALSASPGFWGLQHLRDVLAVEATIQRRVTEAEASLDAILG